MADEVEVKLGAETGPLKSGMSDASASVQASLAKIADALQNFNTKNRTVTSEALKNNADLSRSFIELKGSVQGGFNAISGVIERFRGVMGSIAILLAGGALWKSSVDAMLNFQKEVRTLENIFGMVSDKATTFAIALKLAGSSAEEYSAIALRMGRVLKNQGEEFTRLGVVTKDAAGNLLPLNQIMQNAFATMQTYKSGTDQAEFALSTFGRSVQDVYSLMVVLPAAQKRAVELQQQFGIEMGPERQAQIGRYRLELRATEVAFDAVKEKIGEAVLPQLQSLASWFNDVGPAAARVIVDAVRAIISGFQTLVAVAKIVWEAASNTFENMVVSAQSTGKLLIAVFTGNWTAIPRIVADGNAKIVENNRNTAREILNIWTNLGDTLGKLWADEKHETPGPGPLKSGDRTFTSKPKGGAGGDDTFRALENELKAEENAYNARMLAQGSFEVWSIEQTRDYWEEARSLTDMSAKDRLEIENKFYDAERQVQQKAFAAQIAGLEAEKAAYKYNSEERIRIAQKEYDMIAQRWGKESTEAQAAMRRVTDEYQRAADQRAHIADIERKSAEATAAFEYNEAKTSLDHMIALRAINVQQALALQQGYLDQKFALDMAAIQRELAESADNPVKIAQLNAQKLALEQQYQAEKTRLVNAAELDRKQFAIQAAADIENATAGLFAKLADGTKNWRQTFSDAIKQLTSQLNQLAGQALAKQFLGAGTAGGDFISKITGGIFGGGEATGAAALTAAGTTLTSAGTLQITAATALQAAAAALSASSAGSGLSSAFSGGGGIASLFAEGMPMFANGTPSINRDGLAYVHKGEAVVPASMNQGTGARVQQHNTFVIQGGWDGATQHQVTKAAARATQLAMRQS